MNVSEETNQPSDSNYFTYVTPTSKNLSQVENPMKNQLEFDIDILDAQFKRISTEFSKTLNELRENPNKKELFQKLAFSKHALSRIASWSSMMNTTEGLEMIQDSIESSNLRQTKIIHRKHEIQEILNLSKAQSAIDICFLMDCTGSMRMYVNATKAQIRSLTKTITFLYSTKPRIAFVGYRDIADTMEILDFTDDEEEFETYLKQVQARGGDDTCEDVFGGLECISTLSWRNPNRILIHICDAPCHGHNYHDFPGTSHDNYLDGDPKHRNLIDLMFKIKRLDVIYCKIQLNQTTKKMFDEFAFIFGTIEDLYVENVNMLMKSIIEKTSEIIQSNIQSTIDSYHSSNGSGKHKHILKKEPDWHSISIEAVDIIQIILPKAIEELFQPLIMVKTDGYMRIAPSPFAKGSLRYAYYGQCAKEGTPFVDVVYKELASTRLNDSTFSVYQEHLEVQAIAQYLAQRFNTDHEQILMSSIVILYADASLVQSKRRPKNIYQMEVRMHQKWYKWNNNSGGVSLTGYSTVLQAFSHWTYHVTDGRLMIVDLQGVKAEHKYLLTDPAIHCDDILRFRETRTNLGVKGMHEFFRTHICNSICTGLSRPAMINSMPVDIFNAFTSKQDRQITATFDSSSSSHRQLDDFENVEQDQMDPMELVEL